MYVCMYVSGFKTDYYIIERERDIMYLSICNRTIPRRIEIKQGVLFCLLLFIIYYFLPSLIFSFRYFLPLWGFLREIKMEMESDIRPFPNWGKSVREAFFWFPFKKNQSKFSLLRGDGPMLEGKKKM